ncbi:hypothetical protein L0Y41_02510 [bacterium]|nr:hypothetical protein [bacterium]
MGSGLLEAIVGITFIVLILCLVGVGILALPLVGLLWILYFFSSMTLGEGIAVAGIVIAAAIMLARK